MIRRGVLMALILTLCACGAKDGRDPFTDSRIPPSLGPAFWPPQGWAWGLIQAGGDPPQRYGVAAPPDEPALAQALILPGYGGAAEDHFRAANGFIDRRIQVWTLDGVGQGGSGRIALPRDLGYVDSFDGDVGGVRRMVETVIRPQPDAPLTAIADGTAAPVLLRAAQQGLPGVAALVLTGPRMTIDGHRPDPAYARRTPRAWRWLGYGRRRAPGDGPWRRETDADAPPGSPAFVRHAWRLANPDLRMGGPSLAWLAAFDELVARAKADGWGEVRLPVLTLSDPAAPAAERRAEAALCRALPHCTLVLAAPDQQAAREAAFVAGVAAAGNTPGTRPLFP
jgi:lysophospholipase